MLKASFLACLGVAIIVAGCGSGGAGAGGNAGSDAGAGTDGGTDAGAGTGGGDGGTDAAAGTDGDADGATDTFDPAGEVVVIRGDPAKTYATLTFLARGWGAEHEGRLVVLRSGWADRPPERLVSARALIHDGGFRLAIPIEASLYKLKYLFVDVDGDGVCASATDLVFSDFSFINGDFTLVLDGSVPAATAPGERRMLKVSGDSMVAMVCATLNGPWPES